MGTLKLDQELQKITDTIVAGFRPEKVILFGSRAWGQPTGDSDVDLLVIHKTNNPRKMARDIDAALFPRSLPLDLLVYHPQRVEARRRLGDMFVHEILERGKVLYAK